MQTIESKHSHPILQHEAEWREDQGYHQEREQPHISCHFA